MKRIITAAAAASALLLAGCGGGASSESPKSSGTSGGETTTLALGLVPVVDVAPLYLGMKKGFFSEVGLKIDPKVTLGFGANVASVVNGSTPIGFAATVPLINAIAGKVPVKIVANADVLGPLPDGDITGLMVLEGSPLKSVEDLAGKTVAINAINTASDLAIKYMMKKAGGDPSSIKFVQIPMPNLVSALTSKQVDAIAAVEPFVTAAKEAGARVLLNPLTGAFAPKSPVASYFVSDQWAAKNPKLVDSFVAALNKSTEYALSHPEEARDIIATYAKIPPELIAKMSLGEFGSAVDGKGMESLIQVMTDVGMLTTDVQVSDIVRTG